MARCLHSILASLAAVAWPAVAHPSTCDRLLPAASSTASDQHTLIATDLIELREIGLPGNVDGGIPLGVSPDGKHIAFQIRQADVGSNSYCFGMFVLDLVEQRRLVQVDHGGEFIFFPGYWNGGFSSHLSGYPMVVQPLWSPDGQWIAYLRRDKGVTQAWRARVDGSGSEQLTTSPSDVQAVQWAPDGRALHFWLRPGVTAAKRALQLEALSGYHYDDRWIPDDGNSPQPIDRDPLQEMILDLATGRSHSAERQEALLPATADPVRSSFDVPSKVTHGAWSASIRPTNPEDLNSLQGLVADAPNGKHIHCAFDTCSGRLIGIWWPTGSREVYYLRREGWARGDLGLYGWTPGKTAPHRISATKELWKSCVMVPARLVCMAESSAEPAHIVAITLSTGKETTLFEPNPEFTRARLGAIQRLTWTNSVGLPAFGDLVLPPDHKLGERHPLVLVQYDTRGFLRGGTGNAYPIQLMASAGYAVLSLQSPMPYAQLFTARDVNEFNARNIADQADDRSKLSSMLTGIGLAVATGTIDRDKIAITGLSDGAAKARYALLHSDIFKAAMISSCCTEPMLDTFVGPTHFRDVRSWGLPENGDFSIKSWKDHSILLHRESFNTPLLIQSADNEYLEAVPTIAGLREHHKPVSLIVYPNEYHVLWQPAHRAAQYQRAIDWLDFWLRGVEPKDATGLRREEIESWRQMREDWQRSLVGR